MASREEILADFQACTGIEDVGQAISQLEASEWVLLDAVNRALPSSPSGAMSVPIQPPVTESSSSALDVGGPLPGAAAAVAAAVAPMAPFVAPSPPVRTDSIPDQDSVPNFLTRSTPAQTSNCNSPFASAAFPRGNLSVSEDLFSAGPSSSYGPRFRMLDFYIQHLERTFHLRVPDNEDVKTLKNLIHAETGFKPCQQSLRGFKGSSSALPPIDRRKLSELNLPKENFLHLVTPERSEEEIEGSESIPPPLSDFKLIVTNEVKSETYTLNFRPTQTILNIKLDVATLTDIPVSRQVWTGWPRDISDEISLAQSGIQQEHHLTVNKRASAARNMPDLGENMEISQPNSNQQILRSGQSSGGPTVHTIDSDDDDFEEVNSVSMEEEEDMDFFGGAGNSQIGSNRRIQPLIPDDYGDEALAAIKFSEEFTNRYGSPHPLFFAGTLSDAIKESCNKPAKERKMLAIYLHHDSSVLTNVFCTQALCSESVVSFLSENFVTFGWDLTYGSNKKRAQDMIKTHFGSVAAATISNLDIERLPILALVYKLRGTLEIIQIIHGNVTLDELMSQLLSGHDAYMAQISGEIQEENEREARNAVKREQDLAFEIAQQADREIEEQKKREEEEKLELTRIEAAIKASEEEEKRKEEEEKEKKRLQLEQRLPTEPEETETHAKIRFRVVGGDNNLERRFLPKDKLQLVFDYLAVKGFPIEEHKVLSSWPRRDLTNLDPGSTLEELKLFPQETLTLEER